MFASCKAVDLSSDDKKMNGREMRLPVILIFKMSLGGDTGSVRKCYPQHGIVGGQI